MATFEFLTGGSNHCLVEESVLWFLFSSCFLVFTVSQSELVCSVTSHDEKNTVWHSVLSHCSSSWIQDGSTALNTLITGFKYQHFELKIHGVFELKNIINMIVKVKHLWIICGINFVIDMINEKRCQPGVRLSPIVWQFYWSLIISPVIPSQIELLHSLPAAANNKVI